jgi:hypothetical protein
MLCKETIAKLAEEFAAFDKYGEPEENEITAAVGMSEVQELCWYAFVAGYKHHISIMEGTA